MTNSEKPQNQRGITKISCCRNCLNRHPACHSHCASYLREKRLFEQYKSDIRKENITDTYNMIRVVALNSYYAKKRSKRR